MNSFTREHPNIRRVDELRTAHFAEQTKVSGSIEKIAKCDCVTEVAHRRGLLRKARSQRRVVHKRSTRLGQWRMIVKKGYRSRGTFLKPEQWK
jgi:hypothetical protein